MTITDLVFKLTRKIHREFYAGRDDDFFRDYRALVKAITKYGYECQQRGWEIQSEAIYRDLFRMLEQMRERREGIDYMPVYLETAVKRHVNRRAEEIQAQSMNTGRTVRIIMDGVKPVARVEPSTTELIAELHRSLMKRKKPQPKRKEPQLSLL